jgi:c-di-GMP-binding flagellar brake protein YcgR
MRNMGAELRGFKRVLAQRLGHCRVNLAVPAAVEAVLVDISVGGMKILLEHDISASQLTPGATVSGEVTDDDPPFVLPFDASVAWQRPSELDGQAATALGLRFAAYTELPDALFQLIESYDPI